MRFARRTTTIRGAAEMFKLLGSKFSCCDGVDRRNFLQVGALSLGGLTLAQLLQHRARAAESGTTTAKTSVIFIELAGGPTHFETYDPKPDAPEEYRGPLGTVATSLSSVRLSELMVEQAKIMEKLAIVRSITHTSSSHGTSAHLTQTGYYLRDAQRRENDMPCAGAVTAKLRGANAVGLPAFVSIPQQMRFGGAAYLGKQFAPFATGMDPAASNFRVNNLALSEGLNLDRVENRRELLSALDGQRRIADTQGVADSVDQFTREAAELVTGGKARRAFDIATEDAKTRERYGKSSAGQGMLLARRLVEAGVTFVTVRVGGWDDHGNIKQAMESKGPDYDRGLAALVSDLSERGLDRDVLVIAMGEFGRTPRVNAGAGRDHWGSVMSVLLAGGGLKMGQIVGSSTAKGEVPHDRPYRPENVLAMVYRHLGFDPSQTFNDFSGRPRFLLEERRLIEELV
jgi:hypothetical protein